MARQGALAGVKVLDPAAAGPLAARMPGMIFPALGLQQDPPGGGSETPGGQGCPAPPHHPGRCAGPQPETITRTKTAAEWLATCHRPDIPAMRLIPAAELPDRPPASA